MDIQELIDLFGTHLGWFLFFVFLFFVLPFYRNVRMMIGDVTLMILRIYPPIVRGMSKISANRISANLPLVIELPLVRVRNPQPSVDSKFIIAMYLSSAVFLPIVSGFAEGWFTTGWWIGNSILVGMVVAFSVVIWITGQRQESKWAVDGHELANQLEYQTMVFGQEGFYYSQILVAARRELSYRATARDLAALMLSTMAGEQVTAKNLLKNAELLTAEFEKRKLIRRVRGRIVDEYAVESYRLTALGARVATILSARNGEALKVNVEPDGIRFRVPQPSENKNEN